MHPRDKDGNILWPEDDTNPFSGKSERDMTLDDHLAAAAIMAQRANWTPEIRDAHEAHIRKLWALRPHTGVLTDEEFAAWQLKVEEEHMAALKARNDKKQAAQAVEAEQQAEQQAQRKTKRKAKPAPKAAKRGKRGNTD